MNFRLSLSRYSAQFVLPVAALLFAGMSVLAPDSAMACACGCSVFDVGTSTLLPSGPGGTAYLQYVLLDQSQNRNGNGPAPSAQNSDKKIETDFFFAGGQYMFDGSWGVMAEVPFAYRELRTDSGGGDIVSFQHAALGDITLMGAYSGFSDDMSTGVVFGLKLPTGDHSYPGFDPDTEIGTGSTDLIIGGYRTGILDSIGSYTYFAQLIFEHEVIFENSYRPRFDLNGAIGMSYVGLRFGDLHIAPTVQLLVSDRGRDGGTAGDAANTGYSRLLISPGLEIDRDSWKMYADVELPFHQHVNGNQLIAPIALKFAVSYKI